MMRSSAVPVTMGSPRFRVAETACCRAIEAWFAPGDVLPSHTHDRAVLAVMVEGSFETRIGSRRLECLAGRMWTEPCEERHANYIGRKGARVVVIQPDPGRTEVFEPFARLTSEVRLSRDPLLALDALRLARELEGDRALAGLAIDSIMLGILVRAARTECCDSDRATPLWFERVRELLHESFRAPPSVVEIARVAGVTPSHLSHAFRRHANTTLGSYVRALRLTWATEQLRNTTNPISAIAASAGYADQSHFTRECRRRMGVTPSEYRGVWQGRIREDES